MPELGPAPECIIPSPHTDPPSVKFGTWFNPPFAPPHLSKHQAEQQSACTGWSSVQAYNLTTLILLLQGSEYSSTPLSTSPPPPKHSTSPPLQTKLNSNGACTGFNTCTAVRTTSQTPGWTARAPVRGQALALRSEPPYLLTSSNTRLNSKGACAGSSTCSVEMLSVALKMAPRARQSWRQVETQWLLLSKWAQMKTQRRMLCFCLGTRGGRWRWPQG